MKLFFTPLKQSSFTAALLLLLCVQLFFGCERRLLEEEGMDIENTALIPVKIDWSQSGVDVQDLHRTSIWFFPKTDEGQIVEYRMEGNTSEAIIPVSIGRYSVLVFNETVDESDWTNLSFGGCDCIETMNAFAREDKRDILGSKGFKSNTSQFHLAPEQLASWTLDEFEVTPAMVEVTRNRVVGNHSTQNGTNSPAIDERMDKQLQSLQSIVPKTVLIKAHVKAHITNLSSANSVMIQVKGFAYGVMVASRNPLTQNVIHVFNMNNRTWVDASKKDGTVEVAFYLFGAPQTDDMSYEIEMNVKLIDGTWIQPEHFDVSKSIDKEQLTFNIELGNTVEDTPEDRPIILPEVSANPDVGVNDWNDTEIKID